MQKALCGSPDFTKLETIEFSKSTLFPVLISNLEIQNWSYSDFGTPFDLKIDGLERFAQRHNVIKFQSLFITTFAKFGTPFSKSSYLQDILALNGVRHEI